MTRVSQLQPRFLDIIPDRLDVGVLYISRRYSTASHLCCCGCGLEVVTPLNPAKWHLTEEGGTLSLWPSVGNWSFPCRSHYWVARSQVYWAEAMSPEMIAAVKARDRHDAERLALPVPSIFDRFRRTVAAAWATLLDRVRKWLRR